MKKSRKKSDTIITILLVLVLVIGLSLLVYPTFSNMWNQLHQTHAIEGYAEQVSVLDQDTYDQIWKAAIDYNKSLSGREQFRTLPDEEYAVYEKLLLVGSSQVMGYVEIPEIGVKLPIYHGTDEAVLQVAVGHLEWTSLPTGGASTHCVISGHRGLPSARLFTDLDKIVVGDQFMIHVLDEVLTYEVDQIRIVEPTDVEELLIREGKDLCTLLTCTPYGINSHRLLVRGHRVENQVQAQTVRVTADAFVVEKLIVAPFVLLPLLLLVLFWFLIGSRKRKKKRSSKE